MRVDVPRPQPTAPWPWQCQMCWRTRKRTRPSGWRRSYSRSISISISRARSTFQWHAKPHKMSPPHLRTSYFITLTRIRGVSLPPPPPIPICPAHFSAQSCSANFSHIFAPFFFIRYLMECRGIFGQGQFPVETNSCDLGIYNTNNQNFWDAIMF